MSVQILSGFSKRNRGLTEPNPDSATSKAKEAIAQLQLDVPFAPESYTDKSGEVKPDFARYRRALSALAEAGGNHTPSGYAYNQLHLETGEGEDASGTKVSAMVLRFGTITPRRTKKAKAVEAAEVSVEI